MRECCSCPRISYQQEADAANSRLPAQPQPPVAPGQRGPGRPGNHFSVAEQEADLITYTCELRARTRKNRISLLWAREVFSEVNSNGRGTRAGSDTRRSVARECPL